MRPGLMAPSEYALMRHAEDQHWWYRTLRRLVARLLDRYVDPAARGRVLDAGCGTGGGMARWSRTLGIRCFGIDLASEALVHCRARGARLIARAPVEHLPFPDGVFDAAVSLDVLCLEGVDEERTLAELRRVLRGGGLLILNLPAFASLRGEHDVAVRIRRRYARRDVEALLGSVGYDVLRCTYWNAALLPLVWAFRRVRSAKRPSCPATSDIGALPRPLNAGLAALLAAESEIALRAGLPFGTSVLCAARRR